MGAKRTNTYQINWQTTDPRVNFNPNAINTQSGVTNGVMSSTNTIYSNIQNVENTDNQGLELNYVGTATGNVTILVSNSGVHFYPLTLNPAITQPAGSSDGCVGSLNQLPFKYLLITYTNSSGAGILTAFLESKDLN